VKKWILALSGLLLPTVSALALDQQGLDAMVRDATPGTIELRHQLHANPELSNREFETAKLVAAHLEALGFDDVRTGVAHTGVVGILKGGLPGPVVGLRADMDGLPVLEDTGFSFQSTARGIYQGKDVPVAHACGHDIHTSVGLGTATVLAGMRDTLPGTVKFIFQPAEEGYPVGEEGGASMMVRENVLEDPRPEAIFALHSFPVDGLNDGSSDFVVGQVGVSSGPIYASSDHFIININGRQSHGAWPHLSIDPVVMAAQAVLSLQTIRSRNLDPREPGVLTVGIVRGGSRYNIVPDTIMLEGTVRAYDVATQDLIEGRMHEILKGVTEAGGGSYEMEYMRNNPATINDAELAVWAIDSMRANLGEGSVRVAEPVMGAEDFSYFALEVPSFYFRLAVIPAGVESGSLHTPTFRPDDTAVPVGVRAMAGLIVDYLETHAP